MRFLNKAGSHVRLVEKNLGSNGDDVDTIGVFRGSHVMLRNSNSTGRLPRADQGPRAAVAAQQPQRPVAGDQSLTGDWNGDGIDSQAVGI